MLLHAGGINQRAQRADRTTLLADDLTHVWLRHAHFDARRSLTIDFTNVNCLAIIDERFYCQFDRFAHEFRFRVQLFPELKLEL